MTVMPTTSPAQSPHQPSGTRTAKGKHHWWRWVAAVVVVLVVVFLAAAWYFSGQIASGALTSTPDGALPAFDDVEVVAVDSDSVTLAKGPDAGVNFDADAVYGLAWDGGTGIVGAATPGPDGTVIRPLEEVVTGTAPVVGQLAALDSAYWLAEPPAGLGLTPTEVMVDGRYPAWLFPAESSAAPTTTMAIAVHGQNGSRSDMLRSVDAVHRAGLPVLDITYRNDLGVPADPTGRLQYGASEWQDLDAAVTWARANGADDIVLVGQSMGGAIVASFLEHSDQADVVSKVVLDAPMLSLGALGRVRGAHVDAGHRRGGTASGDLGGGAAHVAALRRRLGRSGLPRRHLLGDRADAGPARNGGPAGAGDPVGGAGRRRTGPGPAGDHP